MSASFEPTAGSHGAAPLRVAYGMVLLVAVVLFFNYVDRGALPTAAHLITTELRLDEARLGYLFSAFFWTYTLAQIPMGWLAERYGAHRVLGVGLAVWATATISIGFAHTFTALLLLRLLLGIGESAAFPCMSKLLSAAVPAGSLGLANGIVAFAYLLGPSVGTYGGGEIMSHFGWRAAFWVFGGLSLLWLVPWNRMRPPPRALIGATAGAPAWRTILAQPSLWGTALGLFSSNYTFYFLLNWLPFYLARERGFSTVEMAQLVGTAYLVNALSALAAGWLIDRYIAAGGSADASYKWVMAVAHGGAVGCMLCMALGSRPWVLASIFVYQLLCGASSPGVYAMSQILAGPLAAGRWVGIQNCLGNLAGVVAPAVTGFIVNDTHRFTAAFLCAAVVSLLGLVGWVWMLPTLAEISWAHVRRSAT